MGLIADLLGSLRPGADDPPPRTIADVEAALALLRNERAIADAAFKAAHQARAEMLVTDATKKEIASIEARADSAALILERLELVEPRLLEELRAVREKAKQDQWRELFARYAPALDDYARKFRAVIEAREALEALRGEALHANLQAEVAHAMQAVPFMPSREALHILDRETERVRDAASGKPRPRPAPAKPAPMPSEPSPPKPMRMVEISNQRMNDPGLLRAKRNREPLRITGPIPTGHVGVRLLKSQIDIGDAFGWTGDEVAVESFKAHMMVANGAAEFIEPQPAPAAGGQGAAKGADAAQGARSAAEPPGAENAA